MIERRRAARIGAPYMKSLALTLFNAKPGDLDAEGRRQLDLILDVAKHGDSVVDDRQTVAGVRQWFLDFGNAWGGLTTHCSRRAISPSRSATRPYPLHEDRGCAGARPRSDRRCS